MAGGRHPECRDCSKFKRDRVHPHCVLCGAGEFFEEKVEETRPRSNDLIRMFADLGIDHDD